MAAKPTTVEEYLASLPAERRAIVEAVRAVILRNLDPDIEESIAYGMLTYAIPHRVYPPGYHCDPKQPLPYASLGARAGGYSLHMMSLYVTGEDPEGSNPRLAWFIGAWKATGKKLDMGKACVRFKKLEDVPLDVLGEAIRRVSAKDYIAGYEQNLGKSKTAAAERKAAKKAPAKDAAPAAKKPAKKVAAKKTAAPAKAPAKKKGPAKKAK